MTDSESIHLRMGTRGSLLARTQSRQVAEMLMRRYPGLVVEEVVLVTSGDSIQDRQLHEVGGKGLFTKEIEIALIEKRVDFAVHSFKDVPVTEPLVDTSGLVIAAVPTRESASDVLVSLSGGSIDDLPVGGKVGTGSLRRKCQLLLARPDLSIEPIRGNIDTRLKKLREGQFQGVILAESGLKRAGLFDPAIMFRIPDSQMLPAAGQGALALQCRADDQTTRRLLNGVSDLDSSQCVHAEREVVRYLNGTCLSPIAARARIQSVAGSDSMATKSIYLEAAVGGRGGILPVLRARSTAAEPAEAAKLVFAELKKLGAMQLLHG